jgi:hypothetical protein
MDQPRAVNTLGQAAEWLAISTGINWTLESILDIVFRLYDPYINGYNGAFSENDPCKPGHLRERENPYKPREFFYLKAHIPDAKFTHYKFTIGDGYIRHKPVNWRFFPLHHNNVGDLMIDGITPIGSWAYDYHGEDGVVFIEPKTYCPVWFTVSNEDIQGKIIKADDVPLLSPNVTINMVRISGRDLTLLYKAVMWACEVSPGFVAGIHESKANNETLNSSNQNEQVATDTKKNSSYIHSGAERKRGRVDVLAPEIENVVRETSSYDTTIVYKKLRDMAGSQTNKSGETAFLGTYDDKGGLYYTDENGGQSVLSKKKLGSRLNRLKKRDENNGHKFPD